MIMFLNMGDAQGEMINSNHERVNEEIFHVKLKFKTRLKKKLGYVYPKRNSFIENHN